MSFSAISKTLASTLKAHRAETLNEGALIDALRNVVNDINEDSHPRDIDLLLNYVSFFRQSGAHQRSLSELLQGFHAAIERKYKVDPSDYSLLLVLAQLDIELGEVLRGRRRLEKVAESRFSVSVRAKEILEGLDLKGARRALPPIKQLKRPLYALIDGARDASKQQNLELLRRYALRNGLELTLVELGSEFGSDAEACEQAARRLFGELAEPNGKNVNSIVFLSSPRMLQEKLVQYGDAIVLNICMSECLAVGSTFLSGRHSRSPARLALLSSIFRTDDFIEGFFQNISLLEGYSETCDHFLLFSDISEKEKNALFRQFCAHENAGLIWHRKDPGLYECWNISARLSQTPYLSNANADDLRHPRHVKALLAALEENNTASVAAAALTPFKSYDPDYTNIPTEGAWYRDLAGPFGFNDLGSVSEESGKTVLVPRCIPHCMPVWRRTLHDAYGYFDEEKYGTYADWAFWLKVFREGERGILIEKPLSYYFVNPASHNRRGEKLQQFHEAVEADFLNDFIKRQQAKTKTLKASGSYVKKLNTHGRDQIFGEHRNSFNKLIHALEPLHKGPEGIDFIPFIERTFVWGDEPGEAASASPRPLTRDWVGVLHVPFDAPEWFQPEVSPENIFQTEMWRRSLPSCRGVIGLSKDVIADFQACYPNIPALSVLHPTELDVWQFDLDRYLQRKRLVQAGDWLRKLNAIFKLHAPDHEKIMLLKGGTRLLMSKEETQFGGYAGGGVKMREFVSNQEYDDLLSSSVVFCLLYGAAANNLILECLARATPIIVTPLPGIVEYLGRNYPLYAETLDQAEIALNDTQLIQAAHQYLSEKALSAKLSYDDFLVAVGSSEFYQAL